MPDIRSRGGSGNGHWPGGISPGRRLEQFATAHSPPPDQGTQLAGLNTQPAQRAPGAPGKWSRFLVAHARWILLITLVAVGGAAALAHAQTPMYKSETEVYVSPPPAEAGALQAPDMATEKGVVSSGAVLLRAARLLHVSQAELLQGLSVNVPASTYLLQIFYSDANPHVAQVRADTIARSYVSYRSPKPVRGRRAGKPPVITTPNATLLTSASLPRSPSSPNYLVDISAALLIGLFLGVGTAALRDHLDDRLRGPLDLEDQAGAPVLALIPAFRWSRRKPAKGLVMVSSPSSVVAEAYRNLRTRLVQAASGRAAKTVLVTSPAWEGKSAVAANLAAALAQAGRNTILICADLRWGYAHELFGLENRGGLARLLSRQASTVAALRATSIRKLRVLPPGPCPPDPGALLQQPAWRTVLGELRRHADVVVIEAPPLLASADTGPLADLAEMILLVADARRSTRAQVRTAMHELDTVRGELIGWVVDNVGRRELPGPLRLPDLAAHSRAREPVPQQRAADDGQRPAALEHNDNGVSWTAPSGTGLAGLDETPKGDDR